MTRAEVIKRLYALADGVEPEYPKHGVCVNACPGPTDELAFLAVHELYGSMFPIAKMIEDRTIQGMWKGERGRLRRTLAGFVAAYLENP